MSTAKPGRAPEDHKPVKLPVKTIDGGREVTLRGVTVTVYDEVLDDFELLDDLRAVDVDKNASRLPALLRRLLGDDWSKAMDALRDKGTGRVSIADGTAFINELMGALSPES